MEYHCNFGFISRVGVVYRYGQKIGRTEYNSLQDIEKSHFTVLPHTEDSPSYQRELDAYDTDSLSDIGSSFFGSDNTTPDSSSDTSDFGGFGGGDGGGGGASGDW